jgi:hypothetical protein
MTQAILDNRVKEWFDTSDHNENVANYKYMFMFQVHMHSFIRGSDLEYITQSGVFKLFHPESILIEALTRQDGRLLTAIENNPKFLYTLSPGFTCADVIITTKNLPQNLKKRNEDFLKAYIAFLQDTDSVHQDINRLTSLVNQTISNEYSALGLWLYHCGFLESYTSYPLDVRLSKIKGWPENKTYTLMRSLMSPLSGHTHLLISKQIQDPNFSILNETYCFQNT